MQERDAIVRQVRQRLQGMPEVKALYARSMISPGNQMAPDVIGVLQFQFTDWFERRPATQILEDFRSLTADILGIELEFRKQDGGPADGKPIELMVSSMDGDQLERHVALVRERMSGICPLYTSPSPRDRQKARMQASA